MKLYPTFATHKPSKLRDTTSSKEATILLYKIIEAMRIDYNSRPDILKEKPFSLSHFNKKIVERYPDIRNKSVLRVARRMGKLLLEKSYKTGGLVQPDDVITVITYLLKDQGKYNWDNVRNVLKEEDGKYKKLLTLEPEYGYQQEEISSLLSEPLKKYLTKGKPLGNQLRKIADRLDDLEDLMIKKQKETEKADRIIVRMVKEKEELETESQTLKGMLKEAAYIMEKLEAASSSEVDPERKKKFDDKIESFKQRINSLNKL